MQHHTQLQKAHQALHDGQTQALAWLVDVRVLALVSLLAGSLAGSLASALDCAPVADLEELVEDALLVGRRNAHAAVPDLDAQVAFAVR